MPFSCKVSVAVRLPKRNGKFSALFNKYDEHEAICNQLTNIYQNNGHTPVIGSMIDGKKIIDKESNDSTIFLIIKN